MKNTEIEDWRAGKEKESQKQKTTLEGGKGKESKKKKNTSGERRVNYYAGVTFSSF